MGLAPALSTLAICTSDGPAPGLRSGPRGLLEVDMCLLDLRLSVVVRWLVSVLGAELRLELFHPDDHFVAG